jgi:hypothetical protein
MIPGSVLRHHGARLFVGLIGYGADVTIATDMVNVGDIPRGAGECLESDGDTDAFSEFRKAYFLRGMSPNVELEPYMQAIYDGLTEPLDPNAD